MTTLNVIKHWCQEQLKYLQRRVKKVTPAGIKHLEKLMLIKIICSWPCICRLTSLKVWSSGWEWPRKLTCLSTCCPVDETALERLGGVAFWKEVCCSRWPLRFQKTCTIPSLPLPLSPTHGSGCELSLALAILPLLHHHGL